MYQRMLLKNPEKYVNINGKFYEKEGKEVIQTKNGWKLFIPENFVFDDVTQKLIEIEDTILLNYIKENGEKGTFNTSDLAISLSKEENLKEIFHDFKNIKNDLKNNNRRKGKSIDKYGNYNAVNNPFTDGNNPIGSKSYINTEPKGVTASLLLNSIKPVQGEKRRQTLVLRIDQVHLFDYKLLLGESSTIFHKNKTKGDKPLAGNYIRSKIRKYYKIPSQLSTISKDNLTFGVEVETNAGCIDPVLFQLRNVEVECSRDGSIQGGEYVTGILNKDAGFYDLYNILDVINQRCTTDQTCGIHVHIGNVMFNKDFVNLSYILGYKIQNELFTLLHPSRSNNLMCGMLEKQHYTVGMKAYSKFKHKIASNFFHSYLYEKMLYDKMFISQLQNKKRGHPGGRYTGRYQGPFNGEITKEQFRYKWLNLITANFNQRNRPLNKTKGSYPHDYLTLEFRPYQATLDYQEIEDWVLFCKAFVKYVFNNSIRIASSKSISIREIITESYGEDLYLKMFNRPKTIGRKTTYPSNLTFSQFLNHRNKTNKINVFNNTEKAKF